ncbi:MAG: sugar ABC transporter permease [Clostridia bacterium]|nr:sugar ABC transporter permease [Clostridia bacterium]
MKLTFSRRKQLTGWIFVGPWLLVGLALLVYPLIFSFMLSFSSLQDMDFSKMMFAGLENYKKAFMTDINFIPYFWDTVSNTVINLPMIIVTSLLLAIMVSRDIKGQGFFRSMFFLPVLLGTGFVMNQLLGQGVDDQSMNTARGILMPDIVQNYLGPEVTEAVGEFFSRITMVLWKSGVQIVITLAGIQGISPSLYESSRVDGATEWEMFWKITLPMISPILLLTMVYTIVASTIEDSKVVNYIVATAFTGTNVQFEFSAAMGWVYFVFILALLGIVFAIMRPFVKRVAEV